MMTALLVLLGLSSCATLAIVSAVVLSARGQMPGEVAHEDAAVIGTAEAKARLVPSYSL